MSATTIAPQLFSPEFVANPYPTYAFLHGAYPFFKLPGTEVWCAVRHADCQAVLRDRRFGHDFAAQLRRRGDGSEQQPAYQSLAHSMLLMDPPDHARLRRLVVKAFDARSIATLRPRIRAIANALIDDMSTASDGDIMARFAHPLPVLVICELLGIPAADRARFLSGFEVSGRLVDPTPMTPQEVASANASTLANNAYFEALCDARRRKPQPDLLTYLVQSETEDGKLSAEELTANISLLFAAGHETTKNLIGNGLLALFRHPDQLALLRAEPGLITNAIEELLRFDSSVQVSGRTALEDCEVAGTPIPRGTEVLTLLGAANHDPAVFADPGRLDIRRPDVAPISFGGGIHYCLGAQLARLEAAEAFPALLARLPRLQLDHVDQPDWRPTITLRGLRTLPAHW